MSGIQTISDIVQWSNEVALYEKLICSSESMFDNFNGQSSYYTHHKLLSSTYHSITSNICHDALSQYGEYESISSRRFRGILSSAYRDVLSSNYQDILPYEYHTIITTEMPQIPLPIKSLKDVFENSETIYCAAKKNNKNHAELCAETNQSSGIYQFLLGEIFCKKDADAISTSLSQGLRKTTNFSLKKRTNDESITIGDFSTKQLSSSEKRRVYWEIRDFSSANDYDRCRQTAGVDNQTKIFAMNETQSLNSNINSETVPGEFRRILISDVCDVFDNQGDDARAQDNSLTVKVAKEVGDLDERTVSALVQDNSTDEWSDPDTSYASVLDELQLSRNESHFYSQIEDVNILSTSSLNLEPDTAGIYDEISNSGESYPEATSIGHETGANMIKQQSSDAGKTIWIAIVSKRHCLMYFIQS